MQPCHISTQARALSNVLQWLNAQRTAAQWIRTLCCGIRGMVQQCLPTREGGRHRLKGTHTWRVIHHCRCVQSNVLWSACVLRIDLFLWEQAGDKCNHYITMDDACLHAATCPLNVLATECALLHYCIAGAATPNSSIRWCLCPGVAGVSSTAYRKL
jgi:hypothetical protein